MLLETILIPHVFSESEMDCCIESYQKSGNGVKYRGKEVTWRTEAFWTPCQTPHCILYTFNKRFQFPCSWGKSPQIPSLRVWVFLPSMAGQGHLAAVAMT